MKQAIEANREDRRRLDQLAAIAKTTEYGQEKPQSKKAIAFDVNFEEPLAAPRRPSVGPSVSDNSNNINNNNNNNNNNVSSNNGMFHSMMSHFVVQYYLYMYILQQTTTRDEAGVRLWTAES